MIDLHCHILPGIDDGPETIDQSIQMALKASADGITTIVATPHIYEDTQSAAWIEAFVLQLNDVLDENNISITIIRGGEFSMTLSPELVKDYSINGGRYVLVEFPHTHLPRTAREDLFKIRSLGFIPILAHPERNPSIIANPALLLELLDSDALTQVTVGSLCGDFGRSAQQCARYLLKQGAVDILASDAHDTKVRNPELSRGVKVASKLIGIQKAQQLVYDTPKSIVEDGDISLTDSTIVFSDNLLSATV